MTILSEIAGRSLRLPRAQTRDVVVEHDLPATMDDGVVLLADRYVARDARAGGEKPPPTVLVRTPYGRRGFFGFVYGRLIAERGFQVVVQSVRGTFGSGGVFRPFDERADGLATLSWLQAQPWVDGPIGMIGSSYMGLTQWAVANAADGSIGALAPSITASQFHGQAYGGGSISLDTALSWTLIIAAQERRLAPLRLIFGLRRNLPKAFDEVALGEVDALIAGEPVDFFREWFEVAAPDDPYWRTRDFSADVAGVTAPVQLVGGWQDIFLPWLLEDYVALRRAGRTTQLIVGPWAHTSTPLLARSTREGIAWLRAHLLGDRRLLDEAPVRIWVGGAREWRTLPEWPPPGARPWRLHLRAGGGLARPSGRETRPADVAPSRFTYDPADPTPSLGGPVLLAREPVTDNAPLEARDDVLVFSGEPLRARGRGDRPGRSRRPRAHLQPVRRRLRADLRRRPQRPLDERLRRADPARRQRPAAGRRRQPPRQLRAVADRPPLRGRPPGARARRRRRPPALRPQRRHRRAAAGGDRARRRRARAAARRRPPVGGRAVGRRPRLRPD